MVRTAAAWKSYLMTGSHLHGDLLRSVLRRELAAHGEPVSQNALTRVGRVGADSILQMVGVREFLAGAKCERETFRPSFPALAAPLIIGSSFRRWIACQ